MRVLITGASGAIGSALADTLLARGDEVVGLTRDPDRACEANPIVSWYAWQATTERPPAEALEGVDAVVNLIGEEINQRLTDAAKRRIRESRITASHNLIQAIASADSKPKAFIGASAIGFYGNRGATILDEDSDAGNGYLAEICEEWEAEQRKASELGMRLVLIRTGLVLDRDSGLLKQLLLPFKLGLGGPLASGEQYMSWIHVDDEVGLIVWALDDTSVSGVINATAPEPASNKDFSKALGRALGRPALLPTPKAAVVALRGPELAELVTGGARVLPRRAHDLGYSFRHPDLDEALGDLVG